MSAFSKFEEYRLFVEDTARLSERRQTVTNIYILVNGAIVGLITFFVKDARLTNWWLVIAILPLILAGITVCRFWHRLLATYRTLLDFRFEQLEAMEKDKALQGCHGMYNLEAERFYRHAPPEQQIGFSDIEMRLPLVFIALYVLLFVGTAIAVGLLTTGVISPPVPLS